MKKPKIHPEFGQEGGPPSSNPGWYRGDGGQWRLDPVRGGLKRHYMHLVLGAFVGLWTLGVVLGEADWAHVLCAQAITTYLFLRYEETEDADIKDQAYRDIGGYLTGFMIASAPSIALAGLGIGS